MSQPTHGTDETHFLRPFVVNAGDTLKCFHGRQCYIGGYALKETTGTANAEIDIISGQDQNGQVVIPITLNPGQSVRDHFGAHHVLLEGGGTFNVVSGSVSGSIWARMP